MTEQEEMEEAVQEYQELCRHIERTIGRITRTFTSDDTIWENTEILEGIARDLNKLLEKQEAGR